MKKVVLPNSIIKTNDTKDKKKKKSNPAVFNKKFW